MSPGRPATLTVLQPGPLTTVQDTGRVGLAVWGVGRSGAADRASHELANRLLANPSTAATLETTFGGLTIRADHDVLFAVTGAPCGDVPHNAVTALRSGSILHLPAPSTGLRTYLGVRGGILVPEVLGSRSTDVLAGLGPSVIGAGDVLTIGEAPHQFPILDLAPRPDPPAGEVTVRVGAGPRRTWFTDTGWHSLLDKAFEVTGESNRVGIRLEGPELERLRSEELPSEGMTRGALQVPPSGKPVLFLADHPLTGGYPVIAYVKDADVDICAQLRPGQTVRFHLAK